MYVHYQIERWERGEKGGRYRYIHILSDTVIIQRKAYLSSLFACISVYSLHYIYLFVYGTLQYHLFSSSSQKKKFSRTFGVYFGIFLHLPSIFKAGISRLVVLASILKAFQLSLVFESIHMYRRISVNIYCTFIFNTLVSAKSY